MILVDKIGKKIALIAALAFACASIVLFGVPAQAQAENSETTVMLYRIYNPNSGEHFYTANAGERSNLCGAKRAGWSYEGVGWVAPESSGIPVYRLYNPNAGDHHYTRNVFEKDMLVDVGWIFEQIGWYEDESSTAPLYRQYNPNAVAGAHNFTASLGENDALVDVGWRAEGIGWYGVSAPSPIIFDNSTFIDEPYGEGTPVPLYDLVSGMDGAIDAKTMQDLLVPRAGVNPSTNVPCSYYKGKENDSWPIANGISENSVSFLLSTSSKSGVLSIELDESGLIQPSAKANCYSFG